MTFATALEMETHILDKHIKLAQVVCFKMAGSTLTKNIMPKSAQAAGEPVSFEAAMAELDQLVSRMESGELPLEASVAAYKRGSELVKFCARQLDKVEDQVKVLEGDMLKPFATEIADEVDE